MTILESHRTLSGKHRANIAVDGDRRRNLRTFAIQRKTDAKADVAQFTYRSITLDDRSRMDWSGGHVQFEVLASDYAGLLDRLGKKIRLRHDSPVSKPGIVPMEPSFSDRTLGLVKEGIIDTVALVQEVAVEEMFDGRVSDARIAGYLAENLLLALIGLADVFRQFGIQSTELSGSDGFLPTVDRYLFKSIPVSSKSFGTFSRHLRADLLAYLYSGGTLSGAWGGLGHRNGRLVLNVEGEPSEMPPVGSRPTVYFDD